MTRVSGIWVALIVLAVAVPLTGCPSSFVLRAFILSPASLSRFVEGTAITFTGSFVIAADDDGGSLKSGGDSPTYEWTSSLDGMFGTGETLVFSGLSVGEHRVSLLVTSGDLTGLEVQTVTIVPADAFGSVSITSPRDQSVFVVGTEIPFEAETNDEDTEPVTAAVSYTWTSSLDGVFRTEADGTATDSFGFAGLSVGEHEITVEAEFVPDRAEERSPVLTNDSITVIVVDMEETGPSQTCMVDSFSELSSVFPDPTFASTPVQDKAWFFDNSGNVHVVRRLIGFGPNGSEVSLEYLGPDGVARVAGTLVDDGGELMDFAQPQISVDSNGNVVLSARQLTGSGGGIPEMDFPSFELQAGAESFTGLGATVPVIDDGLGAEPFALYPGFDIIHDAENRVYSVVVRVAGEINGEMQSDVLLVDVVNETLTMVAPSRTSTANEFGVCVSGSSYGRVWASVGPNGTVGIVAEEMECGTGDPGGALLYQRAPGETAFTDMGEVDLLPLLGLGSIGDYDHNGGLHVLNPDVVETVEGNVNTRTGTLSYAGPDLMEDIFVGVRMTEDGDCSGASLPNPIFFPDPQLVVGANGVVLVPYPLETCEGIETAFLVSETVCMDSE